MGPTEIKTFNFKEDFKKEQYEPWLHGIVNELVKKFPNNPRFDKDDLMSEAWVALTESSMSFDPNLSTSFLGYSKSYIYKRLLEFISTNRYTFKVRYYNIKNKPEVLERVNELESKICRDSINDGDDALNPLDTVPSGYFNIEKDLIVKEESEIIRQIVNSELSPKQRKALVRRFKFNESYQEIGNHLGCSREAANKLVARGLERLKIKASAKGIRE